MNLLLLRGLARECAHWHDFPQRLTASSPAGSRAVCIDLPGTGARLDVHSPASIGEITIATRGQWLERGDAGSRPWVLIGISLGGMVAMDWVTRFPDDFQGLVAISTSTRRCGVLRRLRPAAILAFLRLALARSVANRERTILALTSELTGERAQRVLAERIDFGQRRPIAAATSLRQLAAAVRFRGPRSLPVPALLLAGLKDRLVHPSCSRSLGALLGVPVRCHPEAGHDLPLDQPEWTCRQIVEWIDRLNSL